MTRYFIINILCVGFAINCFSQHAASDSLLALEYRIYKADNDTVAQDYLVRKFDLYLLAGETGTTVLNEAFRVQPGKLKDFNSRERFLWNAALVSYINGNIDKAAFFLKDYERMKKDSSISYLFLSVLINKFHDTLLVNKQIGILKKKDSLFLNLECLRTAATYHRKGLNVYLISSMLLPGSGSIMNGNVAKGLISTALVAGSVFGVVRMLENALYLNSILWGGGLGFKFYTGNIKLTEKLFYEKEARIKNKLANNCELTLNELLKKYPLTFQHL